MQILFYFVFLLCNSALTLGQSGSEESFYDILGVSNDADVRTIRKAFKKLAILKHPDKNPDDPNAHSSFVRINRAYEVLKDEDLRKKYDEHGEAGLADNFNANSQYQSWQFYKDNFGIYDEDQEIVTLSRTDFQEEVTDSGELWFINFYSTYCSHCHVLAPTWREFAREMDGIVRIGAVNCAEDPVLCQSQNVVGYPSLVVYPQHIFYQGPREVESLVQFVSSRMTTPIYRFSSKSDIQELVDQTTLPFVVERKAASMLAEIAHFAYVDCFESKSLCSEFREEGFAYYPAKAFEKMHEKDISFSDLKELYSEVLNQIPDLRSIDAQSLNDMISGRDNAKTSDVVVLFFANKGDNVPDFKKLQFLFNIPFLVANCAELKNECAQMHFNALPRVVLFRSSGRKGFDVHYGNKLNVREASKFLRKSLPSSLISLTEDKYSEMFMNLDDIILIDYFASWCPPCLRLISELRQLPKQINGKNLRVATIDCVVHKGICQEVQVKSYPTSILYHDGAAYRSVGFHQSDQIIEFIEESLNPSVQELTSDTFDKEITNRPQGKVYVVDFYLSWCGPCQQLAPEFRKLARHFRNINASVSFGMVDCEANRPLCVENGIRGYPAIRLFDASANPSPIDYPANWWRDHKSMQHWVNENLPSLVQKLGDNFNQVVLASPQPYLVDFFAPWCGHCTHFAPVFEEVAKELEGEVKLAKVDCDRFPYICQSANVQAYPSVRFYNGVEKGATKQGPVGIHIHPEPNAEKLVGIIRDILRRNGKQIHEEL
ncbi:thioredoxin domain-containing protein [Ditylenchus destructor]|nr:thioredoxin domain-containing protein [Ditylenchus destructor]